MTRRIIRNLSMNLVLFGKYKDLGFLIIRIAFGLRLIYGTADNLLSYDQMLHFRDFLSAHGFPFPLISAFVSVILQFLAGLSFITGLGIRFFSLLMILNFTVALMMVHIGDTYLNMAPAIHLLAISIFFLTNGGGRWSLEAKPIFCNDDFILMDYFPQTFLQLLQ